MTEATRLIGIQRANEQFPTGRWPDHIAYGERDVYLYSVNPSPLIEALDHIHVVNFDLDPDAPYSMTLNLPVMNNLPAKARMYYFYVSRCHNGDTLHFSPVSLSGDTINGVAGPASFTLTGTKILFVCVGVNQNYIIHPISPSIFSPSVAIPNPTLMFNAVNHDGTMTVYQIEHAPIVNDVDDGVTRYTSNSFNPVPDTGVYIPGMDGYITAVPALPVVGLAGFLVNTGGLYRITFNTYGIYVVPTTTPVGDGSGGNGLIVNFASDGSIVGIRGFGAQAFLNTTGAPDPSLNQGGCGTCEMLLAANTYVVGVMGIDSTLGPYGQWGGSTDSSTMTFELIKVTPAPSPSSFGGPGFPSPAPSPAPVVGLNEIVMGSKTDNRASRIALHKKQHQASKDAAQKHQASASSPYPAGLTLQGPQMGQVSLGDLETMFRQFIRAENQKNQQPTSFPLVSSSSSSSAPSSVSSASPSSSNAAGKKRAIVESGGVIESTQPPSKK